MAAVTSASAPRRLKQLLLSADIGSVVLVCVVLAVSTQWSDLPDIAWRFEPGWLALSLAGLLLFQWMHIELWRSMLRVLGGDLDPWKARSIWSTTLLARYVPTSVLMAVGRVALAEREGVPKRVSMAGVIYEVALALTTALGISTYLILTLPEFGDRPERLLVLLVPLAGLAVLHPAVFHYVADRLLRRLGSEPLPTSLSFPAVLRYALGFTLSFVVVGLAVYAMTRALHPIAPADVLPAVASYSLGFTAGVIAFVLPGALGAREAGVILGLSAVVPAPVAIAVAAVLRLVQIGVELLYAGLTPLAAKRWARPAVPVVSGA